MAREWYILHTYSGYENKVEKFIRSYMEDPEFSKTVLDIKVPTEEVTIEGKDGKKKNVVRKFLQICFVKGLARVPGARLNGPDGNVNDFCFLFLFHVSF